MKISKEIALRIKEIVKKQNKTLYTLSKDSGVPEETLRNIMKSKYKTVNLLVLKELIRALNVSFSEFFDSPLFDDGNLDGD